MKFNKQTADMYAAQLKDGNVEYKLDDNLKSLAYDQARASHEAWMRDKISKGYKYGDEVCDEDIPLTNPNLVDFDMLSEEMKKSNVKNAESVLGILQSKGCIFVNFTKVIIYPIARQIHDEWCREKIENGWLWGEKTNKEKKIHRDLVPFEVLLETPELRVDIDYDISTARNIIIEMLKKTDTVALIPNYNKFGIDINSLK